MKTKLIFTLIIATTIMPVNAGSILATISNVSLGPAFRSSGTVLMPTNSWLSPITIPSSPVSSPVGTSSTSLGVLFGEILTGFLSLVPSI